MKAFEPSSQPSNGSFTNSLTALKDEPVYKLCFPHEKTDRRTSNDSGLQCDLCAHDAVLGFLLSA